MKALSIRQPWAELIIRGEKTMELRTWQVRYRGPLAIHASLTVDRDACARWDVYQDTLTTGAVVGLVDLVDIKVLDAEAYHARSGEHRSDLPFQDPVYGWVLANPRRLEEPVPARGQVGLFTPRVNGTRPLTWMLEGRGSDRFENQGHRQPGEDHDWNWSRPFLLVVNAGLGGGAGDLPYSLKLYQQSPEPLQAQQNLIHAHPGMEPVVGIEGLHLRALLDHILDALRRNDYKVTDLHAGRKTGFELDEESGVRLGLLFLAVKPLKKMSRVEAISDGLRNMTSEELYYWYSKCTAGGLARRAQKALRMLLAAE